MPLPVGLVAEGGCPARPNRPDPTGGEDPLGLRAGGAGAGRPKGREAASCAVRAARSARRAPWPGASRGARDGRPAPAALRAGRAGGAGGAGGGGCGQGRRPRPRRGEPPTTWLSRAGVGMLNLGSLGGEQPYAHWLPPPKKRQALLPYGSYPWLVTDPPTTPSVAALSPADQG